MAVYIDNARNKFGRMIMCHMWSDTLDELLFMADKIGVNRKWIQGHPILSIGKSRNVGWIHFDISVGAMKKAIINGAIVTDRYGPVEYCAKIDLNSNDPVIVERGKKMLNLVLKCRTRIKNIP